MAAAAYRKKLIPKARDKVRVCAHARIVGVVFWDRPHNVTELDRAPPDPRLCLLVLELAHKRKYG